AFQGHVKSILKVDRNFKCFYLIGRNGFSRGSFCFSCEPGEKNFAVGEDAEFHGISREFLGYLFEHRISFVQGPFNNFCGRVFSVNSPIIEPSTGRVIGAMGILVDASNWIWQMFWAIWPSVILTTLVAILTAMAVCRREQLQRLIEQQTARLNESEQRLASVLQTQHEMICRFLPDTTLTFVNQPYCRMLGKADKELLGIKFIEFIPPTSRQAVLEKIAGLSTENISNSYEHEVISENGEIRWQEWTDTAIVADGKVVEIQSTGRDVTEKKLSDIALKKSESRLVSILNNLKDVVWSATWPDYQLLFLSPSAEKLYGRPVEDFFADIMVWQQMIHPDDRKLVENNFERLHRDGKSFNEYRIIRPDKTIAWVHDFCRLIFDESGRATRIDGMVSDITRLKSVELELRKTTEELERYFAHSLDMLCIASMDGYFLRLNPQWKHCLGYQIAELENHQFLEFVHPEDRKETLLAIEALADGKSIASFINRYRCKDGSYKWIEWRSRAMDNLIYAVARDVSKSRKLEEKLSRHDAIETLMAGLSTMFINLKPEETDDKINYALEKVGLMLGVDRVYVFKYSENLEFCSNTYEWCAEGVEPQIENLQDVPSSLLPWWTEQMRQLKPIMLNSLSELPPDAIGEREILEPQGIQSILVVPLFYQGEVDGFIGFDSVKTKKRWDHEEVSPLELLSTVLVNASRRKIDELKLRELNATLENRVEQRTKELQKVQAQLFIQDKMVSIGQLAAGLAHEINNPVSFVATNFVTLEENLELLVEIFNEYRNCASRQLEINPQLHSVLEGIREKEQKMSLDFVLQDLPKLFEESKDGFKRITEIVNSMRNFARQDVAESFARYNLNEGIKQTLVIARNAYKHKAELKLELGDVPMINANPGQINQVLLNLIINASQALEDFFGDSGRGIISIKTWVDHKSVFCEIADNGSGIPAEIINRIFDPFFTTKEPGKGTGLGLSISYDIVVNKHGGNLKVQNSDNGGAIFCFSLPLLQSGLEGI
ncbi:MAG: PAS domain-containing sensor histidine kinase, partial [Candidatus Rifleibacteriota bacterium]